MEDPRQGGYSFGHAGDPVVLLPVHQPSGHLVSMQGQAITQGEGGKPSGGSTLQGAKVLVAISKASLSVMISQTMESVFESRLKKMMKACKDQLSHSAQVRSNARSHHCPLS